MVRLQWPTESVFRFLNERFRFQMSNTHKYKTCRFQLHPRISMIHLLFPLSVPSSSYSCWSVSFRWYQILTVPCGVTGNHHIKNELFTILHKMFMTFKHYGLNLFLTTNTALHWVIFLSLSYACSHSMKWLKWKLKHNVVSGKTATLRWPLCSMWPEPAWI